MVKPLTISQPDVGPGPGASQSQEPERLLTSVPTRAEDAHHRVAPPSAEHNAFQILLDEVLGSGSGGSGAEQMAAAASSFREQLAGLDRAAFHGLLDQAFGPSYDRQAADRIFERMQQGDFGWVPEVRIVGSDVLGLADGAYDSAAGVIYLRGGLDAERTAATFAEEVGHHLDKLLNETDSTGDEGELFSRLLAGEALIAREIAAIRGEDDSGTIRVDGQEIAVENGFWGDFVDFFKGLGRDIWNGIKKVSDWVVDTFGDIEIKDIGKVIGYIQKGIQILQDILAGRDVSFEGLGGGGPDGDYGGGDDGNLQRAFESLATDMKAANLDEGEQQRVIDRLRSVTNHRASQAFINRSVQRGRQALSAAELDAVADMLEGTIPAATPEDQIMVQEGAQLDPAIRELVVRRLRGQAQSQRDDESISGESD